MTRAATRAAWVQSAGVGLLFGGTSALLLRGLSRSPVGVGEVSALLGAGVVVAVGVRGSFDHLLGWLTPRLSQWSAERGARASLAGLFVLYSVWVGFALVGVSRVAPTLRDTPHVAAFVYLGGLVGCAMTAGVNTLTHFLEASRDLASAQGRVQVLAFHSRFQPHTMFNALNTIAALVPEHPREAEAAVEGLADLLRRILSASERVSWTVEEEIAVVRALLSVEAPRFGSRLTTAVDLAPDWASRELPPLVVLPLVENALKHGFRRQVGPCQLNVWVGAAGITVQDNGPGRPAEASDGVGLSLVRERLRPWGGRLEWPAGAGCTARIAWPGGTVSGGNR